MVTIQTCPDCGKAVKNLGAHKRFCPKRAKATEVAAVVPQRKPGAHIYNDKGVLTGKVPWTLKDLEAEYGVSEYTPSETIPVTVSGIKRQCIAGVSMLLPNCHITVLEERRRRMRQAGRNLPAGIENYGVSDVAPGALP